MEMHATRRQFLVGAAAAAALPLMGCDEAPAAKATDLGFGLADLTLHRLDGEGRESLAAYQGKPLLLNVWATWCPPCRYEMPTLEEIAGRADAEGLAVLGVSIDGDAVRARTWLRQAGIRFARHLDPQGAALRTRIPVDAVPLNVLFGASGRALWSEAGLRQWDVSATLAWLRSVRTA